MVRLLLVTLLVAAPTAGAAELRVTQVTRAVGIASGVTAPDVSCEPSAAAWADELRAIGAPADALVNAYTLGSRVRLAPWICENSTPRSPRFGEAVYVLGVEAARVAGHGAGAEAMAGCWGLLWSADLARRVWGIGFFTTASNKLVRQALAIHRRSFQRYRTICR